MKLKDVLEHPAAQRARNLISGREEETLTEQLRIVTIPAPSLQEEPRAAYLMQRFHEIGLSSIRQDEVGNVLSYLPGSDPTDRPAVVVASHMDTVFAAGTDLTPRHDGGRVYAPGITDNARGLAALLTIARTLVEAGVTTRHPICFVGTVGEEGSGDLRGVKHLLRVEGNIARPHAFIALDGSGLRRIVHRAIGARRLRVEISGPGGHSWSDYGTANPLHALGRMIAAVLEVPRSVRPLASLTVARAGGGTSVNAIPEAAWLEVDIRSEAQDAIASIEDECRNIIERVIAEENRQRRGATPALSAHIQVIGDRPSGRTAEDAPLVSAAVAATQLVGAQPELVASSTDANVPLSLGIPAVALGAGGESGGIHTTEEWFCNREGGLGLERALLTLLAVAGLQ